MSEATTRYPATVFWSDEDEGFIATATDPAGMFGFRRTQREVLSELQDAIVAWIEAARSAGNPVPVPSDPSKEAGRGGKVPHRMPAL